MACKLDFLQWDWWGNTMEGADGNLLAEFKMMERYMLDASYSNSYDLYTCDVQMHAFIECLDISGARTLSGSYRDDSVYNVSSSLNAFEQAADGVGSFTGEFSHLALPDRSKSSQ